MRHSKGALSAALVISAACAIARSQAPGATRQAPNGAAAMTIYRNGRIYTNDPVSPWAAAMLIRGEEILAVGDDDEVSALAETGAQTVDLEKHFVMPGFNDAHVHIGGAGEDRIAVRLNGVKSVAELQKRLAEGVAQHKEGEWITGRGWDHTFWPDRKFPNRQQLDAVSPKNPVILTHISGHVAVANSPALKIAEIDKNTPNPPGGEIDHDALGEPTGILKEGAAMSLVRVRIPDPNFEQRRKGVELVLQNVARNGVTSVQDYSEWADFQVYQQLKEEGKLTVRITEWLPFDLPLNELQNRQ